MFRFFLRFGPSVVGTFSLLGTLLEGIKESAEPTIPAENWANKDLIYQDRMKGISEEEFHKNLVNGKYKITESYPEPHRAKDGRIIIENCALYNEDIRRYGAYQAQQWVKQGKYNLTPEELENERKAHEKRMERIRKLM